MKKIFKTDDKKTFYQLSSIEYIPRPQSLFAHSANE